MQRLVTQQDLIDNPKLMQMGVSVNQHWDFPVEEHHAKPQYSEPVSEEEIPPVVEEETKVILTKEELAGPFTSPVVEGNASTNDTKVNVEEKPAEETKVAETAIATTPGKEPAPKVDNAPAKKQPAKK